MSDIDQMQLRRLDVTVLLVFLGLMRARKATLVAEELGLTQSTISHALKRLREVFSDELFLRRPHGLEPTAAARALEPKVRTAIEALRGALSGPGAFAPDASDRVLRLGAYDFALTTIVPRMLAKLRRAAPGMRLTARAIGREDALSALALDKIDIAIGYFWSLPSDYLATPLFTETYLVAGAPTHPYFKRRSIKRYAAAEHVVMSPSGELSGIVDRALLTHGLKRKVIASAPLFMPALTMASEIGALVTAPSRFLSAHAPRFGLVTAKPPLEIRSFQVTAVRHRRDVRDPFRTWALELLQSEGRYSNANG